MTIAPAVEAVYVVDDDPLIREALGSLFRSAGMSAFSYPTGSDFLGAFNAEMKGCLVLDVRLPGMNGLELQSILSERGIDLPVIFMTGHGDIPMSVRGMKAGAVDFLPKPFRDQDMLDAVTLAFSVDRKKRLIHTKASHVRRLFASLSLRQRQVMELVTDGKMNKEVAYSLGLSEVTVKTYRAGAMRKMQVVSLADLVRSMEVIHSDEE